MLVPNGIMGPLGQAILPAAVLPDTELGTKQAASSDADMSKMGAPPAIDDLQPAPIRTRRLSEATGAMRHSRRLSELSRQFMDDADVAAPDLNAELEAAGREAGAPHWLRGTVLKQFLLKKELLERVQVSTAWTFARFYLLSVTSQCSAVHNRG